MVKIRSCAATFLFLVPAVPGTAGSAILGWPQIIHDLAKERTQAVACVGLIKSRGDEAAIASAKFGYNSARAEIDGVIAGLTTVLAQGGKPEGLPTVQASLEASGKNLQGICDAALKYVAGNPNTKGVWEEIAKGAVQPLVQAASDGIGALWTTLGKSFSPSQ